MTKLGMVSPALKLRLETSAGLPLGPHGQEALDVGWVTVTFKTTPPPARQPPFPSTPASQPGPARRRQTPSVARVSMMRAGRQGSETAAGVGSTFRRVSASRMRAMIGVARVGGCDRMDAVSRAGGGARGFELVRPPRIEERLRSL